MDKKDFFTLKKVLNHGASINSFLWADDYDKYPDHIWMILSSGQQIKITINEDK